MEKTYESIEDILEEKIFYDTVSNIEKFLGYSLSMEEIIRADVLRAKIREVLDNMDEDDLFYWERKYYLTT